MSSQQNDILMKIEPRVIHLGAESGPQIKRLIPYAKKRMIGPFIFFDYLPLSEFKAEEGLEVRPHPHIGLSTLSYLLEGQVLHHDSLGCKQVLAPGDVNWMTAGSGISHSERVPEALRGKAHRLHLLQFWVALPVEYEDVAPRFEHHPEASIPRFTKNGADISLVAGKAFGFESPVKIFSKLFFLDVRLAAGSSFEFDPEDQELALFVLRGSLKMGETSVENEDFIVLARGSSLKVFAPSDCRFVILGGTPFAEPRHIYWNYVSSSQEKIDAADRAWKSGEFPQVEGEPNVIPSPPRQ